MDRENIEFKYEINPFFFKLFEVYNYKINLISQYDLDTILIIVEKKDNDQEKVFIDFFIRKGWLFVCFRSSASASFNDFSKICVNERLERIDEKTSKFFEKIENVFRQLTNQ